MYAVDADTGSEIWRFRTDDWVVSSPRVADGIVYIGSRDGHLYALDAESGQVIWRHLTGGRVESSPTVDNGVVYFGSFDSTSTLWMPQLATASGATLPKVVSLRLQEWPTGSCTSAHQTATCTPSEHQASSCSSTAPRSQPARSRLPRRIQEFASRSSTPPPALA